MIMMEEEGKKSGNGMVGDWAAIQNGNSHV
jgi:hypothetical protein